LRLENPTRIDRTHTANGEFQQRGLLNNGTAVHFRRSELSRFIALSA